jgi:hypothetical protein
MHWSAPKIAKGSAEMSRRGARFDIRTNARYFAQLHDDAVRCQHIVDATAYGRQFECLCQVNLAGGIQQRERVFCGPRPKRGRAEAI